MDSVLLSFVVGLAYVLAGIAVFVFGSSYFQLFRTNTSRAYRTALPLLCVAALLLVLHFSENESLHLLALGFVAASIANLGGWAVAWLHRPLGIRDDSMKGLALGKGLEAVAVVVPILLVLITAGTRPEAVYLSLGHVSLGLALGLGGFALFAILSWFQAQSLGIPSSILVRSLPWILLFAFANAFMEELWLRALFLRPLVPLVGSIAAVLLTSAVFTLMHIGVTYMPKDERIRFLVILFPLGVAWGFCLHYTGSVIASTLFHAGADLMIINGFIAAFHSQREAETSSG